MRPATSVCGISGHASPPVGCLLRGANRKSALASSISEFDPKGDLSTPIGEASSQVPLSCPAKGALMRRREFIGVIGGAAAALPLAALAQRQTPLVGFLNSASPDTYRFNADSFREGLAKAGFIEGRNVRIEERWARGDYGALPALAAELVAMGVAAIAATGDVASAQAAQLASNTVPVVFTIGGDPVRHGLVESINRPGRHVTGILFNPNVLGAKRVELLREIAPDVSRIALLMNPTNPNFKIEEADAEAGAKKLGVETVTLTACKRNGNCAPTVAECQGPSIDYCK